MKKLNIQLRSDFYGTEPYDHLFDHRDIDRIWYRNSSDGIPRREAFMILENAGLSVPYYAGLWRMNALLGHHRPLIVVYTDQMAHRSEGKEFCTLQSGTADKYPNSRDLLTSIWVDNEGGGAVSYRYRIGI